MKTAAAITLILSAFVFACGYPACILLAMNGPRLVVELDRAGAISEEVIKKDFPQYQQNLRHDLGVALTQKHQNALLFFITIGFISSTFGAHALLKKENKNEE